MKYHYIYNKSGCCKQLNPMQSLSDAMMLVKDSRFNFVYVGYMTEEEAKHKVGWN